MHFVFTKIAWFVLQPSSVIAICLGAGAVLLLLRKERLARRLLAAGAGLYLAFAVLPVGTLLLLTLEEQTTRPSVEDLRDFSGIIVLGGAVDPYLARWRPASELNEAGERMVETVRLAKLFPTVPLVFSGGRGSLFSLPQTEAEVARRFFAGFGLTEPRLKLEDQSRNTAENARFTAELLRPKPGTRWLLVTSASHMMRAKALFEAQGFEIEPWPVDYRTGGISDALGFSLIPSEGLRRTDIALKEWISYWYSWLRGDLSPNRGTGKEVSYRDEHGLPGGG